MQSAAFTLEFFTSVCESWPAGLFFIDADGVVVYINRECAEVFGRSPDDMAGQDIRKFTILPSNIDALMSRLMAEGYFEGEIKTLDRAGQTTSLRLAAALVKNGQGNKLGATVMLRGVREAGVTQERLAEDIRLLLSQAKTLPQLLKTTEVAEMLRVSRDTVIRLITRGELRRVKIGRSVRIRREDVDLFLRHRN